MTTKINAAVRRRLAGSALGGLIAFAGVPAAMAQWLPPWPSVASYGDIAQRLEAQGYVLIAPLQRRPGVYLADVRAGPAGYQRLVIDDRNGEILERFMAPPAPKPEPKIESPPGESENASTAGAPAAPEAKPEAVKIEPQPEAQTQPADSALDPTAKRAAPASSVEASEKSKVSIVPPALFE